MIRAVGYCRVSTDKEDQRSSFAAQKRYFTACIDRNPDWELFRIYADRGITGTAAEKRTQFMQMINDARAGRFQLILTREVSRFSRNLLDTIAYTRELKQLGVTVLFLSDGINTADPDAELRLSIMASLAQEESRKTSERVIWGQTRQMEKGIVFGRAPLGYTLQNGCLLPDPTGAETVRLIFEKYGEEGLSAAAIAACLNRMGLPTGGYGERWRSSGVIRILRNEKYVGDLLQKKTFTPDYLSHKKQKNRGEQPFVFLADHHQPLISRQLWDQVQRRLDERDKHRKTAVRSGSLLFSGRIRCGICGSSFAARSRKLQDGRSRRVWRCGKAVREGAENCPIGRLLQDEQAKVLVLEAIRLLIDREALIRQLSAAAARSGNAESEKTERQLLQLERKKERLLAGFLGGAIGQEELQRIKLQLDREQKALTTKEKDMTDKDPPQDLTATALAILDGSRESESFLRMMTEKIVVYPDKTAVWLTGLSSPVVFEG